MKKIKLTYQQKDELQAKVVDYLANNPDERNHEAVLQQLKEELYDSIHTYPEDYPDESKRGKTEIAAQKEFIELTKVHAPSRVPSFESDLAKMQMEREAFTDTTPTEANSYFSKIAYRLANYKQINAELAKINATRAVYNGGVINECLATLKETYGFDEFSAGTILKFMCQVRLRATMLCKDGKVDIRNYGQPKDYGIMPAFYSMAQGTGKSTLARIIGEVVTGGKCSEHGPDEIMGSFGTLDVFSKPVILLNEMGKTNKDGTDELKKYINGEVVTVNQKYKDPVTENCFASFILTSNVDPMVLNGQDTGSRRICIVEFNNIRPTRSEEEIKECIARLWSACTVDAFEKFYNKTVEDFAIGNLRQQIEENTTDFLISLDQVEATYLMETTHLTLTKVFNYFKNERRNPMPKNKLKSYLESEYFTRTDYGRNSWYKLNQKYTELMTRIEA